MKSNSTQFCWFTYWISL